MKTIIFSLFCSIVFFYKAQTKEQNNLLKNTATVEELQQLLVTDYVAMSEMNKVVPKNQFTVSNLMVLNPYGDVSAQSQAKAIEDQFSSVFNESSWKFDAIDLQNGSQKLTVTTSSGQTESASYNCVGATFHSGTLIEGMDVDAYLFQSKTNKNHFILLFALSNGMNVVADFIKN